MAKNVTSIDQYRASQSEADFLGDVIKLAKAKGYRVFHVQMSEPPNIDRRSDPGFPDLVLVSPKGHLRFFELKRHGKKPTHDQLSWLRLLNSARTVAARVFHPEDWDEIEELLV